MAIIFVTTVVLFFTFNIFTSIKIYIAYRKAPPGVDCDVLDDTYSDTELMQLAGLEYMYLQNISGSLLNMEDKVSNLGGLPCFCEKEQSMGVDPNK